MTMCPMVYVKLKLGKYTVLEGFLASKTVLFVFNFPLSSYGPPTLAWWPQIKYSLVIASTNKVQVRALIIWLI